MIEGMDNYEALARRALACERWRWMAGMKVVRYVGDDGDRVIVWPDGKVTLGPGYVDDYVWEPAAGDLPDLDDPATLGCLLVLVREAHSDRLAHLVPQGGDAWCVELGNGMSLLGGNGTPGAIETEAEALVVALEAVKS